MRPINFPFLTQLVCMKRQYYSKLKRNTEGKGDSYIFLAFKSPIGAASNLVCNGLIQSCWMYDNYIESSEQSKC